MKLTVTRALTELKTLDARINRKIQEGVFIGFTTGRNPVRGYKNNEEFERDVKANYQSIQDLIKRRNIIKRTIVLSNANTYIEIAGKRMTVAEAIERKNSIQYEKELLKQMEKEYDYVISVHADETERVKEKLDELLKKTFGDGTKPSID